MRAENSLIKWIKWRLILLKELLGGHDWDDEPAHNTDWCNICNKERPSKKRAEELKEKQL